MLHRFSLDTGRRKKNERDIIVRHTFETMDPGGKTKIVWDIPLVYRATRRGKGPLRAAPSGLTPVAGFPAQDGREEPRDRILDNNEITAIWNAQESPFRETVQRTPFSGFSHSTARLHKATECPPGRRTLADIRSS